MNDFGPSEARLIEMCLRVIVVLGGALLAGVVFVLLAQVAVTALSCWEALRNIRQRPTKWPRGPNGDS